MGELGGQTSFHIIQPISAKNQAKLRGPPSLKIPIPVTAGTYRKCLLTVQKKSIHLSIEKHDRIVVRTDRKLNLVSTEAWTLLPRNVLAWIWNHAGVPRADIPISLILSKRET